MIAYLIALIAAFISSIFFFLPSEVVLLILANMHKAPLVIFGTEYDLARYGTTFPWLLPFAAALGGNLGSSLYYFMGTGAVKMNDKIKKKMDSFDMEKFHRLRDSIIFFSAISSIPPVSAMSLASGITKTVYSRYFCLCYAGRIIRYYLVIILGYYAVDAVLKWIS